jgi:1-acyl-sn-glycerol-3-phosphate acyltransferase
MENLLRFLCQVVVNVLYRLKIIGRENIPVKGPAVLVCNHVSFVDWLIIACACQRPVRFVMHYRYLKTPFTGRIFKNAKVIPISGERENPGILKAAFTKIADLLDKGEIVCIFPEGTITRDGNMGPFRRGIERIVKRTPVPVIPMALKGMWGSFFSKKHGKPMSRPFRRIWSRLSLIIGDAVHPGDVSAEGLRQCIGQLLV